MISGIPSPITINSFSKHANIKEELLEKISLAKNNSPKDDVAEVNISRADWFDAQNMKRDWVSFFLNNLSDDLSKNYLEIGFDSLRINEIWFQQYYSGSEHGWHSHSANFTNVYYLELPEGSPKTLLLNPINRKEIIEIDVKEGDLLSFPSFVLHKAPKNQSLNRKTIISYNVDCFYTNDIYGKDL
jgi:hypothetical protein